MEPSTTIASVGTVVPVVNCGGFRNMDYAGMSGNVCAAVLKPDYVDLAPCCTGEVHHATSCQQYCETGDRFGTCVQGLTNDTSWIPTSCRDLDENPVTWNGTNDPITSTSIPSPSSNGTEAMPTSTDAADVATYDSAASGSHVSLAGLYSFVPAAAVFAVVQYLGPLV